MWTALLLATAAGLATTLGSLIGLVVRRPGPRFMSLTLGFSAGVLVLVSFVELLGKAMRAEGVGFLGAHLAFFAGMGCTLLIDTLLPHAYIAERAHHGPPGRAGQPEGPSPAFRRTALLAAAGIGIHNLPEGMATFVGSMQNIRLGMTVAAAIAIHNLPEGLAISAPIYAATGSRKQAFLWSFLSGVCEAAGAAIAALVLVPILTDQVLGFALAAVAGALVTIALDELIPAAREFDREHTALLGVLLGMAVMALSLWMLA